MTPLQRNRRDLPDRTHSHSLTSPLFPPSDEEMEEEVDEGVDEGVDEEVDEKGGDEMDEEVDKAKIYLTEPTLTASLPLPLQKICPTLFLSKYIHTCSSAQ